LVEQLSYTRKKRKKQVKEWKTSHSSVSVDGNLATVTASRYQPDEVLSNLYQRNAWQSC